MRNIRFRSVILSTALLAWGCTSSNNNGGSGGSTATGGTKQSGGAGGGSGGSTSGNGGASATGGSVSTGGTKSTGGVTGSGGSAGSTANGGSAGSGAGGVAGGSAGSSAGGSGSGGKSAGGTGGGSAAIDGGAAGSGGGTGAVTVELAQTKQTIEGFGINDNWHALTDAQAKEMFDPNTGIGLTILRTGMKSDMSGTFTNSGEAASIASAKKYGATKIIGSVWSPPANCKDNNSVSKGGHLLASCHGSWSDAITKFAKDNSLYAMSAGNEADFASCQAVGPPCTVDYDTTVYTANEMVAFVKVLGPKLKAAGVKLIAPEASEWIHVWSNISATGSTVASHPHSSDPLKCNCYGNTHTDSVAETCAAHCKTGGGYDYGHYLYKDKEAWAAIDILGVHQYDTQVAEPWPADVNGGKPDKPIWQTEMSGVQHWPDGVPNKDIDNGVAVAGWLHSALTVGEANVWIWWWYQGGNNEGLKLDDGSDTKRHYTFGNYTKFIRPGYVRVDVAGSIPTNVLLSAYKGTDGTVAIVAINKGAAAANVPIAIAGGTAPASCTPHVTSASDNLVAKSAVTVSGGTLAAALASKTVTTFVCK